MNKSEIRKLIFDFNKKCEKENLHFLLAVTNDDNYTATTGMGTAQNLKMLVFDIHQFVVKKDNEMR